MSTARFDVFQVMSRYLYCVNVTGEHSCLHFSISKKIINFLCAISRELPSNPCNKLSRIYYQYRSDVNDSNLTDKKIWKNLITGTIESRGK